jgi:hypothetical protein
MCSSPNPTIRCAPRHRPWTLSGETLANYLALLALVALGIVWPGADAADAASARSARRNAVTLPAHADGARQAIGMRGGSQLVAQIKKAS